AASPGSGLVDAGQSVSFSAPPSAVQADASYLWLHLPDCVALDLAVLHCRTAGSGTFAVQLNVSVTNGTSGESVPLLFSVLSDPGVGSFSTFPPLVDAGQNVTFGASAAGGTGVYTFSWSGLPPGCSSLDATAVSCAPTGAGNFAPILTVRDSNGETGNGTLPPLVVNPALGLIVTVLPSPPLVGHPFRIDATVEGGTLPASFAWSTLPSGCQLTSLNAVNCTESSVTTVRLAVEVRDSVDANYTRDVLVTVQEPPGTRTNGTGAGNSVSAFLDKYGVYVALGIAALLLLVFALVRRDRAQGAGEEAQPRERPVGPARELEGLPEPPAEEPPPEPPS
ncbi:MAG: hypothetical protein ACREDE_07615, partial [Thermoplasmata archaeon]